MNTDNELSTIEKVVGYSSLVLVVLSIMVICTMVGYQAGYFNAEQDMDLLLDESQELIESSQELYLKAEEYCAGMLPS